MKVLFLDIDGVLNSGRSAMAFDGRPHSFRPGCMAKFDHVAIGLVRELCRQTDCSIVLSSDWRYMHTIHEVANGLDLPVFDFTPRMTGSRGKEIDAWLADRTDIESFAIVDDVPEMFDCHPGQFVLSDDHNGLSMANYSELLSILS